MDRFNLMDTEEQYVPEVNDYVIWENDLGTIDEGWVYWKGTPVDNEHRAKFNWRPLQNYITIETGLREKPNCQYEKGNPHKHIHICLLYTSPSPRDLSTSRMPSSA